jgi:hypothetical protein
MMNSSPAATPPFTHGVSIRPRSTAASPRVRAKGDEIQRVQELLFIDPSAFLDQLAVHQGDLADRPAETHASDAGERSRKFAKAANRGLCHSSHSHHPGEPDVQGNTWAKSLIREVARSRWLPLSAAKNLPTDFSLPPKPST